MPNFNNRYPSSKQMETVPFLYQYEMINKIRKKHKMGGNNNNIKNMPNKSLYRGSSDVYKPQTQYYHRYDTDQNHDNGVAKQYYPDYSRHHHGQYYNGNKNYQMGHLQHNTNNVISLNQLKSYMRPQSMQFHQYSRPQQLTYRTQELIHSNLNNPGFMQQNVIPGNIQPNLPLNALDRSTPSPISLDMILDKQLDKFQTKNISLPDVSVASSISSISNIHSSSLGLSDTANNTAKNLSNIANFDINFDPFANKGSSIHNTMNTINVNTNFTKSSSLNNFEQGNHASPILNGNGVNNYINPISNNMNPLVSHDASKLSTLNGVLDNNTSSAATSQDGSIHKKIAFDSKSLINQSTKESSEFPESSLLYNDSSLLFTKASLASIWGSDSNCGTLSSGFPYTSGSRLINTSDSLNNNKHLSSFTPLAYDSLLPNDKLDVNRGFMSTEAGGFSTSNKDSSFLLNGTSQFPPMTIPDNNDEFPNLMSSSSFF